MHHALLGVDQHVVVGSRGDRLDHQPQSGAPVGQRGAEDLGIEQRIAVEQAERFPQPVARNPDAADAAGDRPERIEASFHFERLWRKQGLVDLLVTIAGHDQHALEAGRGECCQLPLEQGLAADLDQAFGDRRGDR